MKNSILALVLISGLALSFPTPSFAASEKETAFVEAYKKAFEANDAATLQSFLYTKGSDPAIVGFYTMMMTAEQGKITSIELQDLTPEDVKKANTAQPGPGGGDVKFIVTPVKKLVIKVSTSDANGSSTSTSETLVADVDGKFVIPVPGPVK